MGRGGEGGRLGGGGGEELITRIEYKKIASTRATSFLNTLFFVVRRIQLKGKIYSSV